MLISMLGKVGRAEQGTRGSSSLTPTDPWFGHRGGQGWGDRERVTAGTSRVWRGAPMRTQTQRAGLCIGVYLSH